MYRIADDGGTAQSNGSFLHQRTHTSGVGADGHGSFPIGPMAGFCHYSGRQISALSGRFRDKWRRYVLDLLASALRTIRMSGFMFSKMFGMFEHFAALLAPVLVSRHGIPPTRIPHVMLARYCQRRPAV
jgi:hypothetical protein